MEQQGYQDSVHQDLALVAAAAAVHMDRMPTRAATAAMDLPVI